MDSAVLRAPNEVAIGQNADHRQITKFSDEKDVNYRPVVSKLIELAKAATKKMSKVADNLCLPERSDGPHLQSPPESPVAFEVSMPKNFKFRGRDDFLSVMDEFFSNPPSDESHPLVYVISGLSKKLSLRDSTMLC